MKGKSAAAQSLANSNWRNFEFLTQGAFLLSMALVVARATMADFSGAREPLGAEGPRGAGPATAMGLDLLCCVPAILVLARRVMDREYVLRWSWSVLPLIALAVWGMLSPIWAANKFSALLGGMHWVAAAAMVWSASQLVRSWMRLRIVAALMVGLLLAYFSYSVLYRFIDVPDLKANWEKNKTEILKQRGIDDPFLAKQFENKVLAGELMGFFTSPNSMGAVVVLLTIITVGLGAQRLLDDRKDYAGVALCGAALLSGWMIWQTRSRTAGATPLLALAVVICAWRWRGVLVANARRAYWLGLGGVALLATLIVLHGLHHGTLFMTTLTFRWQYWVGAMRIVARHILTGVGLNNFGLYYVNVRLVEAPEEVKDPHNFLVRFLSELGIVGGVLCVAWLGRLAWELTRPVTPAAAGGAARGPGYKGPRAIMTFVIVACVGIAINVVASVDFSGGALSVLPDLLKAMIMLAAVLIGASVSAIASLNTPELDARPAPLLLFSMITAVAIFLVHNLIDFSLFEPGALTLFALVCGSVLGVRQPSAAGRKRKTAAAAVALGGCVVTWIVLAGFVYMPTAVAEDAAANANEAMRTKRPNEAVRMFNQAREHQRLNGDYAFHAGQVIVSMGRPLETTALDLFKTAINTNPMAVEYYLARARYLLAAGDPTPHREAVLADFARVMELDPNDVGLRLEYADAMLRFGDANKAREQYALALKFNEALKDDEPKKLRGARVDEIKAKLK